MGLFCDEICTSLFSPAVRTWYFNIIKLDRMLQRFTQLFFIYNITGEMKNLII